MRAQPTPRRASNASGWPRFHFGETAFWTVAGGVLPGLGMIVGGRRRGLGMAILAAFLIGLGVLAFWAVTDLRSLLQLAVRPTPLIVLAVGLPLLAIGWVAVIIRSHLDLRPAVLTAAQRVLCSVLVGVLAFTVAAPLAVAGRYSVDQYELISQVFKTQQQSTSGTRPNLGGDDPFKDKPRLNLLLIGADDAYGGDKNNVRTDTMMVASIDTKTGDTVLVSIPRQTMHIPFPADSPLSRVYPDGYTSDYDAAEGQANAIYYNVPQQVPANILGRTDDLGADALKLGIGEATGQPIDYYVMVNFTGYEKLIDALGGITVNVNSYVPFGGNTDAGIPPDKLLKPGPDRHLNGYQALWFARGRYGSDDYERNERQRCSINAMIRQANPANVLQRYEAIANASQAMVKTDIPQEMLPAMVDLSLRVKDANVRSLAPFFGDDRLDTNDPDYDELRNRVGSATKAAESRPSEGQPGQAPEQGGGQGPEQGGSSAEPTDPASESPSAEPTSPEGNGGAKKEPSPADDQSEDLGDSCAYDAESAENARRPPYTASVPVE